MKALYTFIITLLSCNLLFAQAPGTFSYQAVVRNSSNALVVNSNVGLKVSILQGSTTGAAVYVETHTPLTNANGLFTTEIGAGTALMGNFASINWANGPFFIKTEVDPAGGTAYSIAGITQLLSVPYALNANIADSVRGVNFGGGGSETDPVFNGSLAKNITAADTARWGNKTETDPVFNGSLAKNITAADTTRWGKPEADPVFGAAVAAGISGTDTARWNGKQDKLIAGDGIKITGNTISSYGKVLNVSYKISTTRKPLTVAPSIMLDSFTINKLSATSILIVQGTICGYGNGSGAMQGAMKIGTGGEILVQSMSQAVGTTTAVVHPVTGIFTSHGTTGPQSLVFRYYSAAGGNARPFIVYNPDSSDHTYLSQCPSTYVIYEIEP